MNPCRVVARVYARLSSRRATWLMLVWALMIGLVATPTTADACSCIASPDRCKGVVTADAVFEATVESTELGVRSASSVASLPPGAVPLLADDFRVVTLRDVRSLRGEAPATVITARSGESCGYEFRAGTRYLIVAHRLPDGRLSVSSCGLTRPLSEASGLLEYPSDARGASNTNTSVGAGRDAGPWADFNRDVDPIPAARVTVNGPQLRSVMTGADGRYSLADLPHGLYTVNVALPGVFPQLGEVEPKSLVLDKATPYACAELDFSRSNQKLDLRGDRGRSRQASR